MLRLATVVFFSCWLSALAIAADVKIGEVTIHLPQRSGYCDMDVVIAADARLIVSLRSSLAKTGNRLLVLSADCTELKGWRNGKRPVLDHMAQYQTVLALENGALPNTPEKLVKRYCDEMEAAVEHSMPGTGPFILDRAERAAKDVRVDEIRYLGIDSADPLVCYAMTLHRFAIENAGEFTQATAIAMMILKRKVLLSYLSAPYTGRQTIPQLMARQQANVTELRRANRD